MKPHISSNEEGERSAQISSFPVFSETFGIRNFGFSKNGRQRIAGFLAFVVVGLLLLLLQWLAILRSVFIYHPVRIRGSGW